MMDSPIDDSEGNTINTTPALYNLHRRHRRQTGIVKKNFYELLTPSEGRLSPMGRIAKTLMKQVLKAKGKEEKDIVPYVNFFLFREKYKNNH